MLPGEIDASYVQDHGASLCMHLIMPMLTVSDYQLYDTVFSWRKRHLLLAVLLPLVWLLFIYLLGRLGVRWGPSAAWRHPTPS